MLRKPAIHNWPSSACSSNTWAAGPAVVAQAQSVIAILRRRAQPAQPTKTAFLERDEIEGALVVLPASSRCPLHDRTQLLFSINAGDGDQEAADRGEHHVNTTGAEGRGTLGTSKAAPSVKTKSVTRKHRAFDNHILTCYLNPSMKCASAFVNLVLRALPQIRCRLLSRKGPEHFSYVMSYTSLQMAPPPSHSQSVLPEP